uniref:ATP synthase protein 8 n=1 Tax=Candida blackwelliae TaxID=497110 RepID=S5TP36_9ASCO|nr:ATP synthase F0 subunit 8 [Candida blackwelliae]AGS44555.1 ATP synthase F0 subunit 8 [Candida blackwelliae]
MPQLIPFYFLHLLTNEFISFAIVIYISSNILLPNILRLMIARSIIVRL